MESTGFYNFLKKTSFYCFKLFFFVKEKRLVWISVETRKTICFFKILLYNSFLIYFVQHSSVTKYDIYKYIKKFNIIFPFIEFLEDHTKHITTKLITTKLIKLQNLSNYKTYQPTKLSKLPRIAFRSCSCSLCICCTDDFRGFLKKCWNISMI